MDGCLSDPKIFMKLHVNWGDASAQQSERVPADWGGGSMYFANWERSRSGEMCVGHLKKPRAFPLRGHQLH